jgi:hypothetical protein
MKSYAKYIQAKCVTKDLTFPIDVEFVGFELQ